MPNGIPPSVKLRRMFFEWLEKQYGWQAWIIKQMIGEPPYYQGQNPYYDYWLSAGKPDEKIPTAPPVERQWQPESLKKWEGSFAGTMPEAYQRPYRKATPEAEATTEQEELAASMGISVQELLRSQYGIPLDYGEEAGEVDMTPYQQWQTGFQERQFAWQQQQPLLAAREAGMTAAGDWARMRIKAFEDRRGEGTRLSPEEQRRLFDWARGEMLSGLDPNRDWMQISTINQNYQRMISGIEEGDMSAIDRVRKWEGEVERFTAMHKRATEMGKKAASDPDISLSQGEKDYMEYARHGLTNAYEHLASAEMEYEGEGSAWSRSIQEDPGGGYSVGGREERQRKLYPERYWRPKTPSRPGWAAKMYGKEFGEKHFGKWYMPEKGEFKMAPPSAQAYSRLLPTERQKWAGMAKYYGAEPSDLLQATAQMLPREGRRYRWTPQRQGGGV